jgi:hypothetical protein
MCVVTDKDGSSIPAISAATRAMVFLTNPWSNYERAARHAFHNAAGKLAADPATLRVECFAIDEEADWCQSWLATLEIPQLGSGPIGAGSILWLESGRPVSHEINGSTLRWIDIVARAKALWAQ